jgi:hypothetical protein
MKGIRVKNGVPLTRSSASPVPFIKYLHLFIVRMRRTYQAADNKTPQHMKITLTLLACWILSSGCIRAAGLQPEEPFFLLEPGPLLASSQAASSPSLILRSVAASTGDGGWLTCWVEGGSGRSAFGAPGRLSARLLTSSAERPPPSVPFDATGGAPPAVTLSTSLTPSPFGFWPCRALPGTGGGWVIWQDNRPIGGTPILAQWLSQAAGGPSGPVLVLGQGLLQTVFLAAGDGTHAWISWLDGSRRLIGSVLTATDGNHAKAAEFVLPAFQFPSVRFCACSGSLLVTQQTGAGVVSARVSAAGVVSGSSSLDLPANGFWLGAIAGQNTCLGLWSQPLPGGATSAVWAQTISPAGEWQAADVPRLLAALPSVSGRGSVTPGPGGGIVRMDDTVSSMYVSPSRAVALEITGLFRGAEGTLAVSAEGSVFDFSEGTAARIHFTAFDRPTVTNRIPLRNSYGEQSAPSVAWSPLGMRTVFAVRDYLKDRFPLGFQAGFTTVPGGSASFAFDEQISSPSQAWIGNTQLVAWRREHTPADLHDPDDVVAQIFVSGADGVPQSAGQPFVLGGGLGSQRGVSVAALLNGSFIAAWREERVNPLDGGYLSVIRTATVSTTGQVTPPGGRILDLSVTELSAVSVNSQGWVFWKSYQDLNYFGPTEIRAFDGQFYRVVSPPEHDAVAPQSVFDGMQTNVVWRDKTTRRLYLRRFGAGVSAPLLVWFGNSAREPAIAVLGVGVSAIFWLEDSMPRRLWMAITDSSGVGSAKMVAEGYFDRDTLVASGDGQGRVGLAVFDESAGSAGVKTFILAPLTPAQPNLNIRSGAEGMVLSWEASAVFPANSGIVETSTDLLHWTKAPAGQLMHPRPAYAPTVSGPRAWFRLRAVLAPESGN